MVRNISLVKSFLLSYNGDKTQLILQSMNLIFVLLGHILYSVEHTNLENKLDVGIGLCVPTLNICISEQQMNYTVSIFNQIYSRAPLI